MTLSEFVNSCDYHFEFRLYESEDFLFRTSTKSKVLKSYENRKVKKWNYNTMLEVFCIHLEKE